jgi:hypothetical protein
LGLGRDRLAAIQFGRQRHRDVRARAVSAEVEGIAGVVVGTKLQVIVFAAFDKLEDIGSAIPNRASGAVISHAGQIDGVAGGEGYPACAGRARRRQFERAARDRRASGIEIVCTEHRRARAPLPEITPANVCVPDPSNASVALSVTLPTIEQVAPPAPNCSVPALIVVPPL